MRLNEVNSCFESVLSLVPPVCPTMSENTALGVAMAAGAAKGVDVWSLSSDHLPHVASEKYEPQINLDGERTEKYFLQVCRTDRTMRETTDVVVFLMVRPLVQNRAETKHCWFLEDLEFPKTQHNQT